MGRKAGLSASECCCLEPALTWLKLHHLAICRMDANLLDQTLTCCGLVDNIPGSRVDAEAAWSTRLCGKYNKVVLSCSTMYS